MTPLAVAGRSLPRARSAIAAEMALRIALDERVHEARWTVNWFCLVCLSILMSGCHWILPLDAPSADAPLADLSPDKPSDSVADAALDVADATCNPCDANCDGILDGTDITVFSELHKGIGVPCSPCAGDFDRNGRMELTDITYFAKICVPQFPGDLTVQVDTANYQPDAGS